jgi:exonuclease SbcD
MTRIIHTADWHLGARLIENDRLPEQETFLDWFLAQLVSLKPDLLIVAGDVFDTATPPQESLRLYYRFLARLSEQAPCRVLLLGGNHDSPATLHAPRELLEAFRIQVIATPPDAPASALLEFPDCIVCAVPFLRERDLRRSQAGQAPDEIAAELRAGIRAHYSALREAAQALAAGRPLIATGHLTAIGAARSQSERDIHIGNLGAVSSDCFEGFAYTALGHIHKPQALDAAGTIRYSGSPIPLSFSEAGVDKEFRVLDVKDAAITQQVQPIPLFRPLLRLDCRLEEAAARLSVVQGGSGQAFEPWVELTISDGHAHPDLDRRIRELSRELRLKILKLISTRPESERSASTAMSPALEDLVPAEVFARCLAQRGMATDSEQSQRLTHSFQELLERLQTGGEEATP